MNTVRSIGPRTNKRMLPGQPLFLLPILLLLALPAVVQAQFLYTTNNGTITITGYNGPGGDVTIPSTINGLPVTSIGGFVFWQSSLSGITIPDSVTSIWGWAFYSCNNLTRVTIPSSITYIGTSAFSSCASLTAITVDALNSAYSSVDGVLFNHSQTTLIQCPGGKAGSYSIANSVTSIGDYAFYYCTSLTSVTILDSVISIGGQAFASCSSLTSVTIPNGVSRIWSGTFQGCTSLTGVTIPDSVISIGDEAFASCWSLTGVAIPDGVTSIGRGVFRACYSLKNVTIPDSILNILDYTFDGCIGLTNVTIGDSVTNIGYGAFNGCRSLTHVTFGRSLATIENVAFAGCYDLQRIYFRGNRPQLGGFVCVRRYIPRNEGVLLARDHRLGPVAVGQI